MLAAVRDLTIVSKASLSAITRSPKSARGHEWLLDNLAADVRSAVALKLNSEQGSLSFRLRAQGIHRHAALHSILCTESLSCSEIHGALGSSIDKCRNNLVRAAPRNQQRLHWMLLEIFCHHD
jgi:hypothetical protein